MYPFQDGQMGFPGTPCSNGLGSQAQNSGNETLSPEAAAAVAAVVGLRQQMQMAAAAHHHSESGGGGGGFNLPAHCANIHGNNGGSAGSIPMPKLGSPATSGQQMGNNGGGGVPMPRLASPAMAGMPNNVVHSLAGIPGLHIMQGMMSGQSSQGGGVTISPAHGNHNSQSNAVAQLQQHHQNHQNAIAHHNAAAAAAAAAMNISRISSPAGSAHDLRMTSPDENQMHSPMNMPMESGVNLAVGVSGMAYKPSRGYSPPRPEHLFQEDITDFVTAVPRSCPSRLNSFKEPSGGIKIEPMADCRGD